MKNIIIFLFTTLLPVGVFAQKSLTANVTSGEISNFFTQESDGKYFITFEVNGLNNKQFEQLLSSIKGYRGVETVTTSQIDNKTYFFKVEFYRFANNGRYYKDFFERNNFKNLLFNNKVFSPKDLIETQ